MSARLARDCLTIFVDGDEVPGIIAYGVRKIDETLGCAFPSDAWTHGSAKASEARLFGEAWEVLLWEIEIVVWPAAVHMKEAVRLTAHAMIEGGCRVAWIGAEGLPFCDPPQLFDSECMAGAVLAWMTDLGEYECYLDPNLPLASASNDVLGQLRGHAVGLADQS